MIFQFSKFSPKLSTYRWDTLYIICIISISLNRVSISNSVFFDIGYHGIMTFGGRSSKVYEDILVSNNLLDGCGITNFWQPACIWADGEKNITISNNEATNVPNHAIRYCLYDFKQLSYR